MLATWGSSSGLNKLLASSSLSLDFSRSAYTLGGVPYTVASVPGYTFTRTSGGYAETVSGTSMFFPELRTNLVTYSTDLSSGFGTQYGSVTATAGQTDPNGGTNATKLIGTGNWSWGKICTGPTPNIQYIGSWYVRADSATTVDIQLYDGVIYNTQSVNIGTSWSRISLAINGAYAAGNIRLTIAKGTTQTVYVAFPQLEPVTNPACTYPMDYIPTTTAAVSVSGGYGIANGGLMWFTGTRTNLFFPSNGSTAYNILSNVAVTATGVAGAPDGTSTATTLTRAVVVGDDRAQRNIAIANDNTTYTYSVFIRSGSSQQVRLVSFLTGGTVNPFVEIIVNISTGAIVSGTGAVTKVGSWWRISTNIANNTTGNTLLCALLYPSTTTGSVDYWGAQLEIATDTRITYPTAYIPTTTAAVSVDTPRITNKGYLSEEARTNVQLQSQTFNTWQPVNTTVTADTAIAPDGTLTADTLSFTANSNSQVFFTNTLTASSYVFSVYVKTATGTKTFRLKYYNGTSDQFSSDLTATTTWQRFAFTITGVAVGGNVSISNGSVLGVGSIYAWGAQLEAGAFPTSYIPTTTTAATRAGDIMNYSGITPNTSLTMAVKWIPNVLVSGSRLFYWQNPATGTYFDFIALFYNSNLLLTESAANGSIIFQGGGGTLVTNTLQRGALSVVVGRAVTALNGTILQVNTPVSAIPAITNVEIGNHRGASGGYLNGYVQSATIYPAALTDAQLQAITT